jgi:hypothetical protein
MQVVSQTVLAIQHDQSVDVDWNLLLQRLELEAGDLPDQPDRVGEQFDAITLRTRDGRQGGGAVDDVHTPLDGLGQVHPVPLGEGRFGLVGTVRHDRYSSTHIAVATASGARSACTVVTNPEYEVDFFVCLARDEPVSLHAEISGMDFEYPITWSD